MTIIEICYQYIIILVLISIPCDFSDINQEPKEKSNKDLELLDQEYGVKYANTCEGLYH